MILSRFLKNDSKRIALLTFSLSLIILFLTGFLGCSDQIPTKVDQSLSPVNGKTVIRKSFPIPTEIAWGNDKLWDMLFPHAPSPANDHSLEPIYMVYPNDPSHPQSEGHPGLGIGRHDHVIPVPPHNKGSFSGTWNIVVVLKPEYKDAAAPFTMNELAGPFKSAEEVQDAVNSGNAFLHDIGFNLVCPVRPHQSN